MPQAVPQRRRDHNFTPFPNAVDHLTVTTAKTYTVPAGITGLILTPDAGLWCSGGTAVVPSGDVIDGTGSFFLGTAVARPFDVTPGQTLSFIAATGTVHLGIEKFA